MLHSSWICLSLLILFLRQLPPCHECLRPGCWSSCVGMRIAKWIWGKSWRFSKWGTIPRAVWTAPHHSGSTSNLNEHQSTCILNLHSRTMKSIIIQFGLSNYSQVIFLVSCKVVWQCKVLRQIESTKLGAD